MWQFITWQAVPDVWKDCSATIFRVKKSKTMMIKQSLQVFVTAYPVTQCHISADLNLQQHQSGNLKSHRDITVHPANQLTVMTCTNVYRPAHKLNCHSIKGFMSQPYKIHSPSLIATHILTITTTHPQWCNKNISHTHHHSPTVMQWAYSSHLPPLIYSDTMSTFLKLTHCDSMSTFLTLTTTHPQWYNKNISHTRHHSSTVIQWAHFSHSPPLTQWRN